LIEALGITPVPTQQQLHPLVVQGMQRGANGFVSLANALRQLNLSETVTRHAPVQASLVQWLNNQAITHQGFLVSNHVQVSGQQLAHITVVYHDGGGNWLQADPGTATTANINPVSLVANYAGDVAVIG